MALTGSGAAPAAADLRLLRRYEPVLRFTRGELFLPMPVEAWAGRARERRIMPCGSGSSTGRSTAGSTARGGVIRAGRARRRGEAGSPPSACSPG